MDLTLSEEHEALRAVVEEFAHKEVAPVIGELYERGEFPYELVAEDGRDGPVRPARRRGVRRDGRRLLRALPRAGGAGPRRLVGGDHPRGGGLPRRHADLPLRHRGAEAGVAAGARGGHEARRVRPHRARRRLRRGRHPHHRQARRRRVGDQRLEGVHHQLRHRHHLGRHDHRAHRRPRRRRPPGDLRDHGARGHARLPGVAEVLEGRLERLGHPRAVLRRRARARRQPRRRTRPRLRPVPLDPRRGPGRDRGPGHRARAGLRRRVGALRPRPAGVRPLRSAPTRPSSS